MAFDPDRDNRLRRLESAQIFGSNTSSLGVRRGRHLRGYVYRFIEMCSPQITAAAVRAAI